ncbi:hypothetical protein HGG75_03180 [Ochrobactrum pseudogrignonense]|nr:hypothetical protein [Brucella pseudogrignonensis]
MLDCITSWLRDYLVRLIMLPSLKQHKSLSWTIQSLFDEDIAKQCSGFETVIWLLSCTRIRRGTVSSDAPFCSQEHRFSEWCGMISRFLVAGMTLVLAGSANAQSDTTHPTSLDKIIPVSQVSGVDIVRLVELPKAPKKSGDAASCDNQDTKTTSSEARAVEERGWTVTGEAKLGALQAVSFVADMEQGTSGSCLLKEGNLAFMKTANLLHLRMPPKMQLSVWGVSNRTVKAYAFGMATGYSSRLLM